MIAPRFRLFGLALAAALPMAASTPASAALYYLDFQGTITNSTDQGGVLFGNGATGGQNGLAISGRYMFDSAAYPDLNGSIYNGAYQPNNGLFPQPVNLIGSSFTIAGQDFSGSAYMGPATQHSLEFVSTQDVPPVNFIQQDIYWINDASQKLLCSDNNDPQTCNGGALGTAQITLKLFGTIDWLPSDAMAQALDLDSAAIADVLASGGGGQQNAYLLREESPPPGETLFNAAGEFALSSLRLYEAPPDDGDPQAMPEPGGLALLGLALAGLVGARRRR